MNFLAHLYLSGDNDAVKIGNFIADHVKGKAIHLLPEDMAKGILLHRKIDFFTDTHPVVEKTKLKLRPKFAKYAPVIADIFYDHFLATDWNKYSDITLEIFAADFYKLIAAYEPVITARTRNMLSYMIPSNWLVMYGNMEGLNRIFKGMSRRTTFESRMEFATEELGENYEAYHNDFNEFFPVLVSYCQSQREIMK